MSENDVLKEVFKEYKQKKSPPPLHKAINTACNHCCSRSLQTLPLDNKEALSEHPLLSPCSSWSVYSTKGVYVLRNVFTVQGIRDLLREVLVELVTKGGNTSSASDNTSDNGGATLIPSQVRSNLSCLNTHPAPGCTLWSLPCNKEDSVERPCGKEERVQQLLMYKLRWISLGYHYDWALREYVPGFRGPFPQLLSTLAQCLTKSLGLASLLPDSAIINYYHPGDTLSFHKDDLEWDLSKPLVSISLGLPAVLLIGGTDRHTLPTPLILNTGDVVILSGTSRTAYHAVPCVLRDYNKMYCDHGQLCEATFTPQSLASGESEELDNLLVKYLECSRVNISIRQVEKHD